MSDAALITATNLTLGWGTVVLLENATFEVPRGSIFAILGGSGCGKSTLLRHLIGLERPRSGRVVIEGIGEPHLEVGPPPFGVLFQSGALFGSMTVEENVAMPLEQWSNLPRDVVRAIARAKLGAVGLAGSEDKLPSELSGGMRKRGAIARALALDPPLLFLDEPSAGLDPVLSAELDELIVALNRSLGVTVVFVSHELESILSIATHCIMLDRESRSVIARGDPRELRDRCDDERVRRFFRREARDARPKEAA